MDFLKKLSEMPGVPGREERVRELILKETKGLFDETSVDAMGNLICRKQPGKPAGRKGGLKVLLSCHIDEIGFYVRAIDDKGRLRVQNVGGFDTRNLFARRVLVQGRKDLLGVLNPAGKPIHMASEEEKKKIPEVAEFFVDLFLGKEEVDKLVRVGDPVTLVQTCEEIGEVVCGKCMDNRIASYVAINALRKVGKKSGYEIYYAATVQEEVGLRGAGPATFGVEPDIAIAVDTTLACDTPGIDPVDSITQLGKGVGIKVLDGGSISHRGLLDDFVKLAEKQKIPYQLEILPRGSTDAAAMQRAGAGFKTITLSVPTRYIHTICETVHKTDVQAAIDLLAAWLIAGKE
jgi:endoglucanase